MNNPLISRVRIPGKRYTLPSRGIFYTNGELDESVIGGELEILPMTMVDEIILKTPDKLLNGDGIVEVLSRCVPQIKQPWNILSKDMDFIMICLRIVSYGDLLDIEYTHQECAVTRTLEDGSVVRNKHKYKINIPELLNKSIIIDPTTINQVFSSKMDNGQVVQFKPMTFKDFVSFMQQTVFRIDTEETAETYASNMYNTLSKVIVQVDEIADTGMILEWLEAMTPPNLRFLNDKLHETMQWGPNTIVNIKCADCGENVEVRAPLDPLSFFS